MNFIDLIARYSQQIYAHGAFPELQKAFLDSLSPGQLYSKLAAVEILGNYIEHQNLKLEYALFVGQWHGLLPFMMHQKKLISSGIGIELSETWSEISRQINKDWNWKSIHGDINDPKVWKEQRPNLVVNTSSEHMSFEWLDHVIPGTLILLQSTDYQISEHCNTVNSLDELIQRSNLSKVIKTNEKNFQVYKRFTILGKK